MFLFSCSCCQKYPVMFCLLLLWLICPTCPQWDLHPTDNGQETCCFHPPTKISRLQPTAADSSLRQSYLIVKASFFCHVSLVLWTSKNQLVSTRFVHMSHVVAGTSLGLPRPVSGQDEDKRPSCCQTRRRRGAEVLTEQQNDFSSPHLLKGRGTVVRLDLCWRKLLNQVATIWNQDTEGEESNSDCRGSTRRNRTTKTQMHINKWLVSKDTKSKFIQPIKNYDKSWPMGKWEII